MLYSAWLWLHDHNSLPSLAAFRSETQCPVLEPVSCLARYAARTLPRYHCAHAHSAGLTVSRVKELIPGTCCSPAQHWKIFGSVYDMSGLMMDEDHWVFRTNCFNVYLCVNGLSLDGWMLMIRFKVLIPMSSAHLPVHYDSIRDVLLAVICLKNIANNLQTYWGKQKPVLTKPVSWSLPISAPSEKHDHYACFGLE